MTVESPRLRSRPVLVAAGAVLTCVSVFVLLTLFSVEWWRDASFGRKADGLHWRFSVSLAVTSLLMFAAALTIGPVRVLRGGRPAPHLPWRRSLGVGAAVVGWAHVVFGITIHSTGWAIFDQFGQVTHSHRLRYTLGVALWLGAIVALMFVVLAVTSNTSMMRRLGRRRWKWLQRSAYVAFLLLGAHVLAVQYQERRDLVHIGLVAFVFAVVVALQLAGAIVARRVATGGRVPTEVAAGRRRDGP